MRFERVYIEALAGIQPPETITSADIEARLAPLYQRLGLPEGRLELMTGIRARHFWGLSKTASEASAEAGRALLGQAEVALDEIDLLIHCGVCRDRLEPATAAYVHGLLGLGPCCAFLDVSNACLGFVNAMVLAAGLIECGQARRVLLVSGENGRPLLERTIARLLVGDLDRKAIKPYFANLTIGAGAAAMLLTEASLVRDGCMRLVGGVNRADSAANRLCQGEAVSGDGLEMVTEAEALLQAGIALAADAWKAFQRELDWQAAAIDRFVCHQVGRTHQRHLFERLELDPALDVWTFPEMGNVGSVSLPYTLWHGWERGALQPGQKIALLGIGSGLSTTMLGVES